MGYGVSLESNPVECRENGGKPGQGKRGVGRDGEKEVKREKLPEGRDGKDRRVRKEMVERRDARVDDGKHR